MAISQKKTAEQIKGYAKSDVDQHVVSVLAQLAERPLLDPRERMVLFNELYDMFDLNKVESEVAQLIVNNLGECHYESMATKTRLNYDPVDKLVNIKQVDENLRYRGMNVGNLILAYRTTVGYTFVQKVHELCERTFESNWFDIAQRCTLFTSDANYYIGQYFALRVARRACTKWNGV